MGQAQYKFDCALAQTILYCASGRRKDTEQGASLAFALLPLVEFPCGGANQKFPFLQSFRLSAGGEGGAAKNGRKFLGLPARVRERGRGASGWSLEIGSRKG